MSRAPAYVILGRGRWAKRMTSILMEANRSVAHIAETRLGAAENGEGYRRRLASELAGSGAQVAWLCVPPGPQILPILHACADSGVHAVVEKPWLGSQEETNAIQRLADENGISIGVHYEYCMLDEVQSWRGSLGRGSGLGFGGVFRHSRPNHLAISAIDNLGSHLLSIRAYAVPDSRITDIACAYEMPDERRVWIEKDSKRVDSLDLLTHTQPIVQRFMTRYEAALDGAAFELGLSFALQVAAAAAALKK